MKNSSNFLKAGRIAAKLCQIYRIELTPEGIINKVKNQAELDFYYNALCGVRI